MSHLLAVLLSFAPPPGADASPADRVVPHLIADAPAVVRADLTRLDAADVHALLSRFGNVSFAGRDELFEGADALGLTEAFFVPMIRPDGWRAWYYLVFPIPDGVDPPAVRRFAADLFAGGRGEPVVATVRGDAVVVGAAAVQNTLDAAAEIPRPGFRAAFAAVADAPLQLVVVPTEMQRRAFGGLVPPVGGLTGGDLAAVLRWAAAGHVPDADPPAVLTLGTADAATAKRFADAARTALDGLPGLVPPGSAEPAGVLASTLSPAAEGDRVVLRMPAATLAAAGTLVGASRGGAVRLRASNDLKQLALAFHNFHATHGSFPPTASYDGEKPLLSWRVFLLPYLDEADLYQKFRLDEPWDSEHNRALLEAMPDTFRSGRVDTKPGFTPYLVPFGDGLTFAGRAGKPLADFKDGTVDTALAVEVDADHAVPWTKPADWEADLEHPLAGLNAAADGTVLVVFADGSVQAIPANVDPAEFAKALTLRDGEIPEGLR